MYWEIFVSFIGLSCLAFLCLSIIALRLTLDRRIRSALPQNKVYDSFPDFYLGIGRAICFGAASIFDYPKKSSIMIHCYHNFDVKAFANRYEKALAFLMVISLFSFFLCGIIYLVADWLHVWNP